MPCGCWRKPACPGKKRGASTTPCSLLGPCSLPHRKTSGEPKAGGLLGQGASKAARAHVVQLLGAWRLLARPPHVPARVLLGRRQHAQVVINCDAPPLRTARTAGSPEFSKPSSASNDRCTAGQPRAARHQLQPESKQEWQPLPSLVPHSVPSCSCTGEAPTQGSAHTQPAKTKEPYKWGPTEGPGPATRLCLGEGQAEGEGGGAHPRGPHAQPKRDHLPALHQQGGQSDGRGTGAAGEGAAPGKDLP